MAKTPATDDLTEQAKRLRATGQDPVRWLATLAEREEKLLEWKRRKRITSLGPDEVARAIRETHVWCAPSVILAIGALRASISRRRTHEDETPWNGKIARRSVPKLQPHPEEKRLRRIVDAIGDPGSDVPKGEAEHLRLHWLAVEILEAVEKLLESGTVKTKREAYSRIAQSYGFKSKGDKRPGWEAVERFLLRRRAAWEALHDEKSTDTVRTPQPVSPRFLETQGAACSPKREEAHRCRDREIRNDPAEPNSPSTSRPSSSAARPSRGHSTSPKGRSATSRSGESGRSPSAPKGPGSSSTTSTNGSRTSGAAPRRRPTGRSRSSGS